MSIEWKRIGKETKFRDDDSRRTMATQVMNISIFTRDFCAAQKERRNISYIVSELIGGNVTTASSNMTSK